MSHVGSLLDKKTFERLRYGTWSTYFVVGVTGTEDGLNERQFVAVWLLLSQLKPLALRHGDCIGVDVQVAQIADALQIPTESHPGYSLHNPDDTSFRAFHNSTRIHEPKPFLERDDDIALQSSLLIACPKESREVKRSGTWATVRYARKAGTPRIILLP